MFTHVKNGNALPSRFWTLLYAYDMQNKRSPVWLTPAKLADCRHKKKKTRHEEKGTDKFLVKVTNRKRWEKGRKDPPDSNPKTQRKKLKVSMYNARYKVYE